MLRPGLPTSTTANDTMLSPRSPYHSPPGSASVGVVRRTYGGIAGSRARATSQPPLAVHAKRRQRRRREEFIEAAPVAQREVAAGPPAVALEPRGLVEEQGGTSERREDRRGGPPALDVTEQLVVAREDHGDALGPRAPQAV